MVRHLTFVERQLVYRTKKKNFFSVDEKVQYFSPKGGVQFTFLNGLKVQEVQFRTHPDQKTATPVGQRDCHSVPWTTTVFITGVEGRPSSPTNLTPPFVGAPQGTLKSSSRRVKVQ